MGPRFARPGKRGPQRKNGERAAGNGCPEAGAEEQTSCTLGHDPEQRLV